MNEELYRVQCGLSDPTENPLDLVRELLTWSDGKELRKEFLFRLIRNLEYEQIFHFPQLLVLQKSIEEGKDYSQEILLPFIRENFKKEEIELSEFILEEKQGSLSDEDYSILLKIKRNIPLDEGEDVGREIEFGGFNLRLYGWIEGFGSTENMKLNVSCLNAITKEQFLAAFPGKKPERVSRQMWVYELNPKILELRMMEINWKMIILPNSIAKEHKDYAPEIVSPFVRRELFGVPDKGWAKPLSECLDSLANSQPFDVKTLFKEGGKEEIIEKLIGEYGGELRIFLKYMPRLFPSLSGFIVSLHPSLSKEQGEDLMYKIPFLYLVLYEKGLVPEPNGNEVLYGDHKGTYTRIFRPDNYYFTGEEWTEELKDPCYMFGFGYTVRDDDLEHFIERAEGKENEEYQYFYGWISLKDMAASLGAERIWNWLGLNGFKEGHPIHAFGGRNMEIIKDVLKNTECGPEELLSAAAKVYNYDVFSYLVELHGIERLWFGDFPSPRFLQKIKYPEHKDKDYMTWYYAEQGIF